MRKVLMMSKKMTLKNEQIIGYLRTDDAIKALQTAVDNGQLRLSLQILTEVVENLWSSISDEDAKPANKEDEKTVKKEQVEKPSKKEVSITENKAVAKEESIEI